MTVTVYCESAATLLMNGMFTAVSPKSERKVASGTSVHAISSLVLPWNCGGSSSSLRRRNLTNAYSSSPVTMTPSTTDDQNTAVYTPRARSLMVPPSPNAPALLTQQVDAASTFMGAAG